MVIYVIPTKRVILLKLSFTAKPRDYIRFDVVLSFVWTRVQHRNTKSSSSDTSDDVTPRWILFLLYLVLVLVLVDTRQAHYTVMSHCSGVCAVGLATWCFSMADLNEPTLGAFLTSVGSLSQTRTVFTTNGFLCYTTVPSPKGMISTQSNHSCLVFSWWYHHAFPLMVLYHHHNLSTIHYSILISLRWPLSGMMCLNLNLN